MAPEQFDGLIHCSERSDIYSFGLILYEGVSGKMPVRQNPYCRDAREVWADLARQHREEHLPKLDCLLWPVIFKCISKNPADRFGSFSEIGWALENILRDHFGIDLPVDLIYERNANGLANKAASLLQLGGHAAALEQINRALEMEPSNANFLTNKANILLAAKRPTEATIICRIAIEQNPKHANSWITLGLCMRDISQTAEAISAYRKGIDIEPENHFAWSNLGNCLAEEDRFDEAAQCFKQAKRNLPRPLLWYHSHLGLAPV